jgi:hypothetical protein
MMFSVMARRWTFVVSCALLGLATAAAPEACVAAPIVFGPGREPIDLGDPGLTDPGALFDLGAANEDFPDIAADGNGNWLAAWISASPPTIRAVKSRADGSWQVIPSPICQIGATGCTLSVPFNPGEGGPRIASDHAGGFMVVWTSHDTPSDPDGPEIFASRWTGAAWLPIVRLTSGSTEQRANSVPAIAFGAPKAGDPPTWMVVWAHDTLTGASQIKREIRYAIYQPATNTWSSSKLLTDAGFDNRAPDVDTDGEGTWVASWSESNNSVGTDWHVKTSFAQNINAASPWSPKRDVGGLATWTTAAGVTGGGRAFIRVLTAKSSGAAKTTWLLVALRNFDSSVDAIPDMSDVAWTTSSDLNAAWGMVQSYPLSNQRLFGSQSVATDRSGTAVLLWDLVPPQNRCSLAHYLAGRLGTDEQLHWGEPIGSPPNTIGTLQANCCEISGSVPAECVGTPVSSCGGCGDRNGTAIAYDALTTRWIAAWSSSDPTPYKTDNTDGDGDILFASAAGSTGSGADGVDLQGTHLHCYKVTDGAGNQPHTVFVTDQFGRRQVVVKGESLLCTPARKCVPQLQGTFCWNGTVATGGPDACKTKKQKTQCTNSGASCVGCEALCHDGKIQKQCCEECETSADCPAGMQCQDCACVP